MKQVFLALEKLLPVNDSLKDTLTLHTKEMRVKKPTLILREGQICDYVYFIKSGLLRHYYMEGNQEKTPWLLCEGHFCTNFESWSTRKPSTENIEILENSVLQALHISQVPLILSLEPQFKDHIKEIERVYRIQSDQIGKALRGSPEEKYRWFLQYHENIVQRVKLEVLASYLNMSINTLRDLRKRI